MNINTFTPSFSAIKFGFVVLCTILLQSIQAQNISVNPGAGSYPTLKDAFDAINAGTHTGAITIAVVNNTTETASAVLNASGVGAANYTSIMMTPSGGASRTISGALSGAVLVDLNGADNVTIDGLNTGGNSLTIENSALGASNTIRFINDASNNTIIRCSLKGSADVLQNGVIFFSTGTTTGNDNNIINNCDIGPSGANSPINGIFALGSAAPVQNSNNTITNNRIFDFFNSASTSIGIHLNATNAGNTNWTISNNRLYQTTIKTYGTANTHQGIFVGSGVGYLINDNKIGAANAGGTGLYEMTSTVATRFIGIGLGLTAGAPATSVQANQVYSVKLSTSSGASTTNGILCGLNIASGDVNVGTATANTFGSTTGTQSLWAIPTTANGLVVGINTSSTGTINIQNNTFGAFFSSGTTAAVSGNVVGIQNSGVATALTITNNMIGNTTTDNMQGGTNGLTTGSSMVSGISIASPPTVATITNNTIQNLASYGTNTTGFVRGIWTGTTVSATSTGWSISNNTIQNLLTQGALVGLTSGNISACGIHHLSSQGCLISQNTITNIANINNTATTHVVVAGIISANATATTTLGMNISRNKIWNIKNSTIGTTLTGPPTVGGIIIRSGNNITQIDNNMITLGDGQTGNISYVGIWNNNGSTPNPTSTNVWFNSVQIRGTSGAGTLPTFAYYRGQFTATAVTVTVDVKNNIFDNIRTGGTGGNFAISNNFGATVTSTGWSPGASNFNILNSSDANTVGHWGGALNFTNWKTTSSCDAQSISGATVNFVNAANGDLHIMAPPVPPIEGAGIDIPAITVDFDGQTRSGLTPVDIGADAGNFSAAPAISYTPLLNTCTTGARTLIASITDPDGVPTSGIGLPVLYWRINSGPYMAATGSFVSGSNYSFTFGAGAVIGDIITYYIAAQDNLLNVGTGPSFGSGGYTANPPAAATPPTFPTTYKLLTILNGTYNVGTGGAFPTITAAVAAWNESCLGGHVIFNLTDATYPGETFPIIINQNPDSGPTKTLTIKPSGNTTISGSSAIAIFVLNGADYVTIDGSNGNTPNTLCPPSSATRNLTIENTNTGISSAVVWLQWFFEGATPNSAQNNKVINCNIVGNAPTTTLIGIGSGSTTISVTTLGFLNNNNQFINNDIRKVQHGIMSRGQSAATKNTGNIIHQNLINTASPNNVGLGGIGVGFEDGMSIQGNKVGNITNTSDDYGINAGFALTSGISATTSAASAECTNMNIAFNIIDGIANTGTFASAGIALAATPSGTSSITNNTISGILANATSLDIGVGILSGGGTGTINVFNNTVVLQGTITGATAASSTTAGVAMNSATPPTSFNVKNNIFVNTILGNAGATMKFVAFGLGHGTPYTGITSSNNVLFAAGAGPGTYAVGITGGITAGVLRTTLVDWQLETNQDLNSFNFLPVFVSGTDLHLVPGDATNAPLLCGGANVNIPTDRDCQERSPTTPTIGSDEVPNGINAAITVSESSGNMNNDGNICQGATAVLTAVGTGTYLWSTGATTASITVNPGATTSYSVTITSGTCQDTANRTITVNPLPVATIAPPSATVCAGQSQLLTASGGGTYAWSTGASTAAITVTPSGTTTYIVTVTSSAGCKDDTSALVTVNPAPIANITPTAATICAGASQLLTASGGGTYLWNTGATTAAITITPSITTTYTVTVTAGNGCTASIAATVTVNPLPSITKVATNPSSCSNNNGSIDQTVTNGAPFTFTWTGPGGFTASTEDISGLGAGKYKVTVTNTNGCIAQDSTVLICGAGPPPNCSQKIFTYNEFSGIHTFIGAMNLTGGPTFNNTGTLGTALASGNYIGVEDGELMFSDPGDGTVEQYNWGTGVGVFANSNTTLFPLKGVSPSGSDEPHSGELAKGNPNFIDVGDDDLVFKDSDGSLSSYRNLNLTGTCPNGGHASLLTDPTWTTFTGGPMNGQAPMKSNIYGIEDGFIYTLGAPGDNNYHYYIYATGAYGGISNPLNPTFTGGPLNGVTPRAAMTNTVAGITYLGGGALELVFFQSSTNTILTYNRNSLIQTFVGLGATSLSDPNPLDQFIYNETATSAVLGPNFIGVGDVELNFLDVTGHMEWYYFLATNGPGDYEVDLSLLRGPQGGGLVKSANLVINDGACDDGYVFFDVDNTLSWYNTVTNLVYHDANWKTYTGGSFNGIAPSQTNILATEDGLIYNLEPNGSLIAYQICDGKVWPVDLWTYTTLTSGPLNGQTLANAVNGNVPGVQFLGVAADELVFAVCQCPTIPTFTSNPASPICNGTPITLTASGLTSMGMTYGIKFVSFSAPTSNPYSGGTVLGIVPNGSLGGGGTTASFTTTLPAAGTYYIYAILDPIPMDVSCRPSASLTMVVNPNPIADILPNNLGTCGGQPIALNGNPSGGTPPYTTHLWTGTGASSLNNTGIQTPVFTNSTPGTYSLTYKVTDSKGCMGTNTDNVNVVNCMISIKDPCSCKNNATTLTNGQFDEKVEVMAPTGQVWTVTAVNGLFLSSSPAPPAAPTPIPLGTVLVETPAGSGKYQLSGIHVDAIGYTITVSNGVTVLSISNTCYYPNPTINNLNPAYCLYDPAFTLLGSATLGGPPGGAATGVGSFMNNGVNNNLFNPGTLGAGTHTVKFTFDAADGVPNAQHPGCIQAISQTAVVNPTPTVNPVLNMNYCEGQTVPAITFTGAVPGTVFNWTRTPEAIGAALNGTNTVPSFVATNTTTGKLTSTFTVTPTFTNAGITCTGTPITFKITVEPPPVAKCKDITIQLDANGNASITPAQVDNGSTGVFSIKVSPSTFSCSNVGLMNIVTLTVTDSCNFKSSTCQAKVTVLDVTPPVITCPANISITLDPGECNKGVDYVVTAKDNCEITLNVGQLTTTLQSGNAQNGNMYDLTNKTGNPIVINSFDINIAAVTAVVNVYYTTTANTYVGNTNNAAAWTLLGTATVTGAGAGLPTNVPIGGLILAPNQVKGIYITCTNGQVLNYTNIPPALTTYQDAFLRVDGGIGKAWVPDFSGAVFNPRMWNGRINYSAAVPAPPTLTLVSGKPSGSLFNIGTTCQVWKATDNYGNMSTCSFCVTIKEYPQPVDELICNDELHVSLDANCEAVINADMVLEGGPYKCYDNYTVEILNNGIKIPGSPKIGKSWVGKELMAKIIDPATGNVCWGNLIIEDKIPPKLVCDTSYISCDFPTTPGSTANVTKIVKPTVPLPAALADAAAVGSFTFNVSGLPPSGVVPSFDLEITHNFPGILIARLTPPNGASVITLFQNIGATGPAACAPIANGGLACDNLNMSFFDLATGLQSQLPTWCTGGNFCGATFANAIPGPPYGISGKFQSAPLFSNIGTSNYNGTWTLTLTHAPFTGVTGASVHRLEKAQLKFNYIVKLANPNPSTVDACGESTVSHTDKETFFNCSSPYVKQIQRTWTAIDQSGNKGICTENIFVLKGTLADIVWPPNYDDTDLPVLNCTVDYPTPTITGSPGGSNCSNLGVSYVDETIPVCQNSYKIIRHWTVLDWCSKEIAKHDQIIKVLDKTAPVVTCPNASNIHVEYYTPGVGKSPCTAHIVLPWPVVTDNCSTFDKIKVQVCVTLPDNSPYCVKDDGSGVFEMDVPLPTGMFNYTFTFEAKDDCGNIGTCSVPLMIADIEEPVAVCEKNFVVSLSDSTTLVDAETFDDGSYDDCSAVTFLARRMDNPACNFCYGSDATSLAPQVPFYCCDAKGGPVMVVLRVRDAKGNFNECMVEVNVFDKIRPLITCPPDITLECGNPYIPKGLNNVKGASGTYSAAPIDIKTINNCDTLHFWKHPNQNINPAVAKTYVIPIDITGVSSEAIIEDVDLSLKIDHEAVNQLRITLWSPDGKKAVVIDKDGCKGATPNWFPEDIYATLNDEAYDIDYYNTWKNILCDDPFIPAYFTCTTTHPSIGSFNYGHMRPQGDHLKVFDGSKINSKVYKDLCATVGNSLYPIDYIDPNTNRMSSNDICNLIAKLELDPGDKIILKYAKANGGTLTGLTVGWPYIFKVIDNCTLELIAETGDDITAVPAGSTHMFCATDTWIAVVEDLIPLGGGKIHDIGLHIAYTRPVDHLPKVSDNAEECGLMISYQDLEKPDECNSNVVRRQWRVADMFGNNRSCIQRITFIDKTPLVVQFPCDLTINCEDQYDLTKVGDVIHNGDCELVGVKYDDHVLPINGGEGCIKIHRLWKVIDWCEYNEFENHTESGIEISPLNPFDVDTAREWYPNTPWHDNCPPKKDKQTGQQVLKYPNNPGQIWKDDGDGYWLYLQEIVILDQKAPVFDNCGLKEFCNFTSDCTPISVELKQSATDNCEKPENLHYQYSIDLNNDGTVEYSGVTNDASGTYPNGNHSITWKVTDACNNTATCKQLFTIKDCKKPTPVVVGLNSKTMPNNCLLTIWATDWEKSSYDNCTTHDHLKFCVLKGKDVGKVYPDIPPPGLCNPSAVFDSTELGQQSVAIYIQDEAGNWDHAETYIIIDPGDCGVPQSSISITGKIETEVKENVEQVEVKVTSTGLPGIPKFMTQSSGTFNFPGLPMGNQYTVTPVKDIKPLNGVNTYDLVLIQKHLLNIQKLNSPYKMIAADANKSNSVSVADIVELRKLILKINTNFTNNTSWRFFDKKVNLNSNPFPVPTDAEVVQMNGISNINVDFIGVKIGDVDGTALANNAIGTEDRNFNGVLKLIADQKSLTPGEQYTIEFKANQFRNVEGYQFTMNFDPSKLDIIHIDGKLLELQDGNFGLTHLTEGMITTSWNHTALSLKDGELIFTITVQAKEVVQLNEVLTISSQLTESEAYVNSTLKEVILQFTHDNEEVPGAFVLYQNEPNPFHEASTIGFNLPKEDAIQLKIYDEQGRIAWTHKMEAKAGYNKVELKRSELTNVSGLLHYELQGSAGHAVKSMIVIE